MEGNKNIWKRFSSEEEPPKPGTRGTFISDGFINSFIREFPQLYKTALTNDSKMNELKNKIKFILSFANKDFKNIQEEVISECMGRIRNSTDSLYFRKVFKNTKKDIEILLKDQQRSINERGKLRVFALLKWYKGETVDRSEGKLYQDFNFYSKKCNRTGTDWDKENIKSSLLKNKHNIKLFEIVIAGLSGEPKRIAEEELKELKNNIKKQEVII